jgi:hypothetical protein
MCTPAPKHPSGGIGENHENKNIISNPKTAY